MYLAHLNDIADGAKWAIAEGIVDGETGLLHAPGDEDALTSHLIALLTDPERRAQFGAAGRAHVVRSFDLRRQTAQLEALYDDVCRQGARSVS